MPAFILAFQSAGDAIAGERKLLDAGVEVELISAPMAIRGGCGAYLKVYSADMGKVRLLLGETIMSIHPESENGNCHPIV